MQAVRYRSYTEHDREAVLNLKLRPSDVAEVHASTGKGTQEALKDCLQVSTETWVVLLGEQIVGVFGLAVIEELGVPWFLATNDFDKYRLQFARQSRHVVSHFKKKCKVLMNYVDARNVASQRWLEWLGFVIDRCAPTTLADSAVAFYTFRMEGS